MRSIAGFAASDLVRTQSGGTSFTVCQDKGGVDERVRRARQWIATKAVDIRTNQLAVSEGPVIVHSCPRETSAGYSAFDRFLTCASTQADWCERWQSLGSVPFCEVAARRLPSRRAAIVNPR